MIQKLGYTHSTTSAPTSGIDHLNQVEQQICILLSDDPFIRQQDIAKELNLTVDQLKQATATIRNDELAQNYILHKGLGTKYWTNTIKPLLDNGSLSAAIKRTYMYPNRVGLYTGISCMFYCNFCGRNPVASYDPQDEQTSFEIFKQIIDQDPRDDAHWEDRFRISGGLEPLTNPHLGNIITYGKENGYKMQLYTNGYMMTSKYLEKHPGMLDLYAVRFSLYGVDKDSAYKVTRNPKSFDNIIENIITYINASDNVRVGVNWIILPGHTKDVLKLIDIIDHINSKTKRPVDFVTLREDFSQNVRVISDEERANLIEIFDRVNEFKTKRWPATHWDFGYSLEPLVHGKNSGPLKMISWQEMVPEGFTQVAVAVDVLGDVYSYHESGFLDRPGANRYIIGNIKSSSVDTVVKDFVTNKKHVKPLPPDVGFLDAFDHVVSILINQARDDEKFGIPWSEGPVKCR
jgi:dTDP-4-amino-4,6-dideoxy-D-glucose ammonia-lyase